MENKTVETFDGWKLSSCIRQKRMVYMRIGMREAAKEIGISTPTLSRLENKRPPDINTFYLVCKWLNREMSYFFTAENPKTL